MHATCMSRTSSDIARFACACALGHFPIFAISDSRPEAYAYDAPSAQDVDQPESRPDVDNDGEKERSAGQSAEHHG